jgi:hypothetical protein
MTIRCALLAGAGLLALGCISVSAQQITGVPGSPEATTSALALQGRCWALTFQRRCWY